MSDHRIERPARGPGWSTAIAGSTVLGLLPYLDRMVYTVTGSQTPLGGLGIGWFVALFAVLGAVAGAAFSLRGALGGPVSCVIGLGLLTVIGFVGRGGDGDLFYVLGVFGSAVFSAFALGGGFLRMALSVRRRGRA
jgi:hypothetical protein